MNLTVTNFDLQDHHVVVTVTWQSSKILATAKTCKLEANSNTNSAPTPMHFSEPMMQSAKKRVFLSLTVIGIILLGIGGTYAVVQANSGVYRMPNSAMEPTIKDGATFSADMAAYKSANPQRWDPVTFRSPQIEGKTWVFRVVGLPGETISFGDDGLLVDGKSVELPARLRDVRYHSAPRAEKPFAVPNLSYYLLGDNSDKANDSRFWGAVSRDAILGRVDEN